MLFDNAQLEATRHMAGTLHFHAAVNSSFDFFFHYLNERSELIARIIVCEDHLR